MPYVTDWVDVVRVNVLAAALYPVYRLLDAWADTKEIGIKMCAE